MEKNFKSFAKFLLENHLEELSAIYIHHVKELDVPLLKFFTHFPEEQLKEMGKISVSEFLTSIEDGTVWEKSEIAYTKWKDDTFDSAEIGKNDIHPSDIILISAARKKSFLHFLNLYTTDLNDYVFLVNEIEQYFTRLDNDGMRVFYEIQKSTEYKYKESEERYRNLFENANDLIHIADVSGQIIFANKVWLETMGYSHDKLPNIQNIIHPNCLDIFIANRQKAMAGEKVLEFEFSVITSKGKNLFLEGSITCQFEGDKPLTTQGIFTNITVRKLNEQRLQIYTKNLAESEEKFSLLIENIKDYAIFMLGEDGTILSWNIGAEKIKGFKANEVIGKNYAIFYIDEDRKNKEPEMNLAKTKELGRFEKEGWRLRKDGTSFLAHTILTALYDKEGKLKGFAKVTRDITHPKKAEEDLYQFAQKLIESESKLQAIFDNAPDAIIVADYKPAVIGWNKAAETIYGYSKDEVLGKNVTEVLMSLFEPPFTRDSVLKEVHEKGIWRGEVSQLTKSGHRISVLASSALLYDDKNNPIGFLSVNKDITDRKIIEQNLQRFAQELIDSEEQIQTILESAPDAVIVIDQHGLVLQWNNRAEEIFGWHREEVLGKPYHHFIIPSRYQHYQIDNLFRFQQTGEGSAVNKTIEIEVLSKEGTEFPVSLSIAPTAIKGNHLFIGFVRDITERKRSDEKITKTLQQLNEAQQMAHIGSWEMDIVSGTLAWSDELFRIYGLDPIINEPTQELIQKYNYPEDLDVIAFNMQKALEDKKPFTFTYRIKNEQGLSRTLLTNGNVILDSNNNPVRMSGTVQDITEQKEKDDQISLSLEQMNQAQKMSHIGNWDWDVVSNKIIWSDELYRLYDLTPEEFNSTFEDFVKNVHPEDRDMINNKISQALRDKKPFDFDHRIVNKNGKIRILRFHGIMVTDKNGHVIKMSGTGQDITERKEKDNKIARALEQLNEAQRLAHIGSWELDLKTNKVNWSAELYRIYGYEPDEFQPIFDDFATFVHPDDKDLLNEVIAQAMIDKQPFNFDHRIIRNDGSLRILNVYGVINLDDEGNAVRMSGTEQDVTDRVLTREVLIKAEETVKAKQQFLSNMSHEIRTPMNAIIGFTKVVLKTDLSTKQREYLDAIKISGQTLLVLINDILDLAKVDAGKMKFEKIPFRLSSSISAMLHLFDTKTQEKNLKLLKQYDEKIPEVLLGDPVRLHQIILNLVSNAVKFTHYGQIIMRVILLEEDDTKARVQFSVSDTGIGISEDKIDTIFENFQQASSETARLYGGTGLGLAIVKQLVEHQGGQVSVRSKPKEGTTFTFDLTFEKTNIDVFVEMEEETDLEEGVKHIKVLVVEDIPLNQLLMKTLLDEFGFNYDMAGNGKIAIEKLENDRFDIILMDLQMPEMNGFETTEYIRNHMAYPISEIPIIALTADVTTADLAKCTSIGMNDYLAKPMNEKLLFNKITKLLKKPIQVEKSLDEVMNDISNIKEKCINLDYLNQRTKGNSELLMEMISLYLEQTPTLIKTMRDSIHKRDWEGLLAASHKIIPSFSIVGINPEFEEMAKKIHEYALLQQKFEEINDMFIKIERVCLKACQELDEEYKKAKIRMKKSS